LGAKANAGQVAQRFLIIVKFVPPRFGCPLGARFQHTQLPAFNRRYHITQPVVVANLRM